MHREYPAILILHSFQLRVTIAPTSPPYDPLQAVKCRRKQSHGTPDLPILIALDPHFILCRHGRYCAMGVSLPLASPRGVACMLGDTRLQVSR